MRRGEVDTLGGFDILVNNAGIEVTALVSEIDAESLRRMLDVNIVGTRNVLEIARTLDVERVVHISSTAVYGIPDHHPLLEDDRLEGVGA